MRSLRGPGSAWSWAGLNKERAERKAPSEAGANPEYQAISDTLKSSAYGEICNALKQSVRNDNTKLITEHHYNIEIEAKKLQERYLQLAGEVK